MSSSITVRHLPAQKIKDSKKNDEWMRECVDAAESIVLLQNDFVRTSRYRKQVNYDLYNGKMHPSDLNKIMNPMGLKDVTFPAQARNYPITNPYLQTLIGEEIKRRFDYFLKVENEDAISEKEKAKKEEIFKVVQDLMLQGLQQPEINPEDPNAQQIQQQFEQEVQKRLQGLNKYLNYEWQDIRELAGTNLLRYYYNSLNLKQLFSRGFEDALIAGEEIYCVDIIANEPVVRKCNPLNTYYLMPPDGHSIEESDVIVEEYYVPLSRVIDDYHDYLKPHEIDELEEKCNYKGRTGYGGIPNYELQDPIFAIPLGSVSGININSYSAGSNSFIPFDQQNNVRVVRVVWRSMRRIGILTYIDENGQAQEKPVHEDHTPDKDAGESIRYIWIGEWWEGTKIANEYYVKMQPRPIQFRKLNNLSECASGYVGSLYKTNSSQVQSLMDIMKPYQYMFNMYMYRTELAFIKAKGRIGKMDLAKVPDGWQPDKWLYYAEMMGWAVEDSFKEAKKGAATGKLAGQMSGSSDSINLELGNYINQHIQMLTYIEQQLDKITGINAARKGQMMTSDQGLGVTQESRQASATITEWYYNIHDYTKLRVISHLLETAKYCLRNKNKKIQYITDDMNTRIFEIDGELINECELGIVLRNATSDMEALTNLRKATEIAMQTGQVDVLQLIDIYSNDSLASIRRKLEASVNEKQQQQQQQSEAENQIRQQEIQTRAQLEQQKLELERYIADSNNQTRIQVAEIQVFSRQQDLDTNQDGIPDPVALADQALKERELFASQFQEQQKLSMERERMQREGSIKEKELQLKEEELKAKERIEKMKADTALKVAKTNKNKYDSKSKSKK